MQWENISKLIQLFKENNLGELEYEDENFKLKLGVPPVVSVAAAPAHAPVAAVASAASGAAVAATPPPVIETGRRITSPFVGTFYRQPSPDSNPYVEVGQMVSKGQILCIIEAMKLMNEIEADISGRVARIYVENGRPIEFGESLFLIEPL
ncbi:MAG: acetyl-CoA carboxylase biotin carboxyl carrier protein [Myxococcota bacterium]